MSESKENGRLFRSLPHFFSENGPEITENAAPGGGLRLGRDPIREQGEISLSLSRSDIERRAAGKIGEKKMEKHIQRVLGMVKSNLDIRGAKGPKLELDCLRLVYSVRCLRQSGDSAIGYLVVMTPKIAKTVNGWISRYDARDSVKVIVASLSAEQMLKLAAEKEENRQGMVAGTIGKPADGRSDASYGQSLGEEILRESIRQLEPGLKEVTNKALFPFGIRWDYYGVSEDRDIATRELTPKRLV